MYESDNMWEAMYEMQMIGASKIWLLKTVLYSQEGHVSAH